MADSRERVQLAVQAKSMAPFAMLESGFEACGQMEVFVDFKSLLFEKFDKAIMCLHFFKRQFRVFEHVHRDLFQLLGILQNFFVDRLQDLIKIVPWLVYI